MNMSISFTVNAVPVAQPRQRHRIINNGHASFVSNYTPARHPVNAFKAAAQDAAASVMSAPFTGPVAVWLLFVMPRPANKTKKRGDNPRLWKSGKPDLDNLYKSLTDSLNGIAWVDDAQIAWSNIQKVIASASEIPRVEVRIVEMADTSAQAVA